MGFIMGVGGSGKVGLIAWVWPRLLGKADFFLARAGAQGAQNRPAASLCGPVAKYKASVSPKRVSLHLRYQASLCMRRSS